MTGERAMMNSKIPVKKSSQIPVRIDVKKKSSTKVPPKVNLVSQGQSSSLHQKVSQLTSKDKLANKCTRPGISTSKTLKAKEAIQEKNKNTEKLGPKKTSKSSLLKNEKDNKLKQNKFPKTLSKGCNVAKAATPVPLVKSKIKVEARPTKSKFTNSHPSQPDIEFVPDEVSRRRILGCIDIPSAPSATYRGQSSIYNRPSLYRATPLVTPSDPCKALQKTLERLRNRDGRESIQSVNWRDSLSSNRCSVYNMGSRPSDFQNGVLRTLQNIDFGDRCSISKPAAQFSYGNRCYSLARKTPKMVLEEAKKRFEEKKLQEGNKSSKKVTFHLFNTAAGKENKAISESSPFEVRKDNLRESSTPKLELQSVSSKKLDETPTLSGMSKTSSREINTACKGPTNAVKQPVSILKNKALPPMDARRGSLFSSMLARNALGKMRRRSVSFSDLPLATSSQSSVRDLSNNIFFNTNREGNSRPAENLESAQKLSPACLSSLRRSISSPEMVAIFPVGSPKIERKVNSNNILTPSTKSTLDLLNAQTNDLVNRLRSSVHVAETRGSLYLLRNQREVPQSKKPILCTPVPVSFYPKSKTLESFSPEFLCPRTSNYIADAPIKTPLVMRNLAEREENYDLNQVRQKLTFMPPAVEENNKPKHLTHVVKQNLLDCMADQECTLILCKAVFPYICSQDILNPIAKTLEMGDEMHFVPVSPHS